jgi:mycothiol synthase
VGDVGVRPATLDDAGQVAAVLNRESQRLRERDDVTVGTIRGWWTQPPPFDLTRDTVVAMSCGSIVGYGDIADQADDGTVLWLDVRGEEPEALLEELERRAGRRAAPGGVLRTIADELNAHLLELLRGHGFTAIRASYRMMIDLACRRFEPRWPGGASVRIADRDDDERLLHRLLEGAFADHWGFTPRPYREWRHWLHEMGTPERSLWFVVDAAGEPVAASICRPREYGDPDCGWVSELGVLPGHRRRGIASALLEHAFASFAERGLVRAGLGVDAENTTGAVRLYERLGMRVVERHETWERVT